MSRDGETVQGGCFCGAVTYEITLPTKFCGHCHCSMCRRPHGASYVTWAAVPPDQFRVLQGEAHLSTFESSEIGRRQFCKTCGSQMFCWHEKADGPPDFIDIAIASLQGDIDRAPQAHWYYDSRAAWTSVQDNLPKLGGASGLEPLETS